MVTHTQVSPLIVPYGGSRVDLMVPAEAREEVKARASQLPSIQLSERSVCDLNKGQKSPSWFTQPEVAEILAETYRPLRATGQP